MKEIHVAPSDNLSAILDEVPPYTTICLAEGEYIGKYEVQTRGVKLIGAGARKTVIRWGDFANKIHADGREYNTFRTYTLCVTGDGVTLENLTVENSNTDPATVGQCVALSVNATRFRAKCCRFTSTQDTIFLAPFPDDLVVRYMGLADDNVYYDGFIPHRQLYTEGGAACLFENCEISGTVDFIFGCAEAYFKKCRIVSLKESRGTGYIAAPAHPLASEYGFTFIDCDLEDGGADEGSVYLARPWRDFGKCVFIDCRAGKHINRSLFDKWNDTRRDRTARFAFCNLSGIPFDPVQWSTELSRVEANKIIARSKEKIKEIYKKI